MIDAARLDLPSPGCVAWLDISGTVSDDLSRPRTGPLGLSIMPLADARADYEFHGGRLRGTRCVWSASTVAGAMLTRAARPVTAAGSEPAVHLLARIECPGSVFDAAAPQAGGTLRVFEPTMAVNEQFPGTTRLYTLNVPQAALGLEPAAISGMLGGSFDLSPLQVHLLHAAVSLLVVGEDELTTTLRLVGVDRYLGALAGLVLRTAVTRTQAEPEPERVDSVRARVDAIIREQAADPTLTPASIAAQLNISLRQLYRAFIGSESPAARIRSRRLERAAQLLAARPPRPHVEQVAQQCGFVSAEYFSRAFRREYGLSPRAYRSTHSDRAAAG